MTTRLFIIDTNVVVAGLISNTESSPTVKILNAMLGARILYVLSPAILQEYREVLLRPRICQLHGLSDSEVDQILSEITANSIWQEPTTAHSAPDIGDDHIWSLLLHSPGIVLVTGDQLLLRNPPVDRMVITPQVCSSLIFG